MSGAEHFAALMGVAYSPVSPERFDPARLDRGEARRRLDLDGSAPGARGDCAAPAVEGQDDAIQVAALLRDHHPEVRLLLVGSGHLPVLGERAYVPAALAARDVLLVPSWQERFGRAIIEAMAMERPEVASNAGV